MLNVKLWQMSKNIQVAYTRQEVLKKLCGVKTEINKLLS